MRVSGPALPSAACLGHTGPCREPGRRCVAPPCPLLRYLPGAQAVVMALAVRHNPVCKRALWAASAEPGLSEEEVQAKYDAVVVSGGWPQGERGSERGREREREEEEEGQRALASAARTGQGLGLRAPCGPRLCRTQRSTWCA